MGKQLKLLFVGAGAFAALALCLSGCGSKSSADPTTTTSSTTIDPTVVPATITPQYLDGVLVVIEHVRGDVRREVYSTQSFPLDARQKLADIYADPDLPDQLQIWSDSSMKSHPEARANPGDEVLTVNSIDQVTNDCIIFHATDDNSAVVRNPLPPTPGWAYALLKVNGNNGPNTTHWKIGQDLPPSADDGKYSC